MTSRFLTVSAIAAAALLALSGCSAGGDDAGATVIGTWGDASATDQPSLVFEAAVGDEEARYSGTDGCNRVGGDWSVSGDTVDLGAMISTMMFCEGVDDWLTGARTATVDGTVMTFLDEDGKELGTLERTAD